MSSPTHQDAQLVLQLFELRREKTLRKARKWFSAEFRAASMEEFDRICPKGSRENAYFRMVVSYWEMAASFVTQGVLNRDLFYASGGEMLMVWIRVERLLPIFRELFQDTHSFSNLERVAQDFAKWRESRSPGSYEAFKQFVG